MIALFLTIQIKHNTIKEPLHTIITGIIWECTSMDVATNTKIVMV